MLTVGSLGWTAGSMIVHDKIIGPLIQAGGQWAAAALQLVLTLGVLAVGYWQAHKK